ncbi:MAG: LytR/AlgR family response regulator transcription factor [Acetanaerobacterium sp.]
MLKIAICDDDFAELEKTYDMGLDFWRSSTVAEVTIRKFSSPYDLLDSIETEGPFHLYLLDILMPEISGIDVGARIRQNDENALLVYLTSSPDYALESYRLYAFQYLLKPIKRQELCDVFERATEKLTQQAVSALPVKTKGGIVSIPLSKIIYVEYTEHRLKFCLTDGSFIQSLTMREPFDVFVGELIKDKRFIRPHVAFVVNLRFVHTLTAKNMELSSKAFIPISRNKYTEIKKQYIDFVLKGGNSDC